MKKRIIVIGLSAVVLFGGKATYAATNVPGNVDIPTEGTIKFIPDPDGGKVGEIHKPDETGETPEVIELPNQGNNGTGNLRIQFVPNFNFGQHDKITAAELTETVTMLEYNPVGNPTKRKIAPFVQVTDERGKTGIDAYWTLSVKASPFTAELAGGSTDVLKNCEIKLNQSTLTMDYQTSASAANHIVGQAANASIKADGSQVIEVLKTVDGQSTNGTNVSNVFLDGYQKGTTYTNEKTAGVTFYKPAGQAPLEGVSYKSTLNWTLTTGK